MKNLLMLVLVLIGGSLAAQAPCADVDLPRFLDANGELYSGDNTTFCVDDPFSFIIQDAATITPPAGESVAFRWIVQDGVVGFDTLRHLENSFQLDTFLSAAGLFQVRAEIVFYETVEGSIDDPTCVTGFDPVSQTVGVNVVETAIPTFPDVEVPFCRTDGLFDFPDTYTTDDGEQTISGTWDGLPTPGGDGLYTVGDYPVTWTPTTGCSESYFGTFTVIDELVPGVDELMLPLELCNSSTDAITLEIPLSTAASGQTMMTGFWQLTGGIEDTGLENEPLSFIPADATSDMITATFVPTMDCAVSASLEFTLVPAPFSGNWTGDTPVFCFENMEDFDLFNLLTGDGISPDGEWSGPGDVEISGSTLMTGTLPIGTTQLVYTVGADGELCGEVATTVEVNVLELPAFNDDISTTETSSCGVDDGTISGSFMPVNTPAVRVGYALAGSTDAISFDNVSIDDNTFTISGLAAASYDLYIEYEGTPTCPNVAASAVIVSAPEAPAVSISASATEICQGGSVDLMATVSPMGNISYTWGLDGGGPSADDDVLENVSWGDETGEQTITLDIVRNGCSASAVPIVVNITPNPSVSITGDPSRVIDCNSPAEGIVLSADSPEDVSYQWFLDGTATGTSGANLTVDAAGSYTVQVTLNDDLGCSSEMSAPVGVTVDTEAPTLELTSDVNPATLTCTVESIELTATATSSGGSLSYDWSTSAGNVTSITVNTEGTYGVTVTNDNNGCNSEDEITVGSNTNRPEIEPIADLTLDCNLPSSTVEPEVTNDPNSSYSWSGPNGFSFTGEDLPLNQGSEEGEYTLTVLRANNSCDAMASFTLSKDFREPAFDIVNAAGGEIEACAGTSIMLEAELIGEMAGDLPAYAWSAPGVDNGSNPTYSLTVGTGSSVTVNLEITYASNGCNATETAQVMINPNPVVDNLSFIANANDATGVPTGVMNALCLGGTGVLTALVSSGTGGYDYEWRRNGAVIGGADGNTLGVNESDQPAGIMYSVRATDTEGCTVIEAVELDVFGLPGAAITSDPDNFGVCAGEVISLMAEGQGTISPYIYGWEIPGGSQTGQEVFYTAGDDEGTDLVTLSVTDGRGCKQEFERTVTVYEKPSFTLSVSDGNNNIYCSGEAITVVASDPNLSYLWLGDPNLTSSETLELPDGFSTTNSGGESISIGVIGETMDFGCRTAESISVLINPNPNVNSLLFSADANENTGIPNVANSLCLGGTGELISSTSSGTGDFTYTWRREGVTVATTNTGTLPIAETGVGNDVGYEVIVTDVNGCRDDRSLEIDVLGLPNASISSRERSGFVFDNFGVCEGDTIRLEATPFGTPSPFQLEWEVAGNSGIGTSITYTTQQEGTDEVLLVVTDGRNCRQSFTESVNVHLMPDYELNASDGNNNMFCSQEPITITSNDGNLSYVWQGNTAGTSGPVLEIENGYLVDDQPAEQFEVAVVGTTTDFGCSTMESISFFVERNPAFIIDDASVDYRTGNGGQFDIDLEFGIGLNYQWTIMAPSGEIIELADDQGESEFYTFNQEGEWEICVSATSVNDCETVRCIYPEVTSGASCLAGFRLSTPGPEGYCINELVQLTDRSTRGDAGNQIPSAVTYRFERAGGNNGIVVDGTPIADGVVSNLPWNNGTADLVDISFNNPGTWTITQEISGGQCNSSDSETFTVVALPQVPGINFVDDEVCIGDPVLLNFSIADAAGAYRVFYREVDGAGGDIPVDITNGGAVTSVIQPQNGNEFFITSIRDNGSGCINDQLTSGGSNSSGVLRVNELPVVTDVSFQCLDDNLNYLVIFNVVTSNSNNGFSVMPADGTISGNTFTSTPILLSENYMFDVVENNTMCSVEVPSLINNCFDCDTEIGDGAGDLTWNNGELSFGQFEAITISEAPENSFFDNNDFAQYILKVELGGTITNLDTVTQVPLLPSGEFNPVEFGSFDSYGNFNLQAVYSIDVLIANEVNGVPSLEDPCRQSDVINLSLGCITRLGSDIEWNGRNLTFCESDQILISSTPPLFRVDDNDIIRYTLVGRTQQNTLDTLEVATQAPLDEDGNYFPVVFPSVNMVSGGTDYVAFSIQLMMGTESSTSVSGFLDDGCIVTGQIDLNTFPAPSPIIEMLDPSTNEYTSDFVTICPGTPFSHFRVRPNSLITEITEFQWTVGATYVDNPISNPGYIALRIDSDMSGPYSIAVRQSVDESGVCFGVTETTFTVEGLQASSDRTIFRTDVGNNTVLIAEALEGEEGCRYRWGTTRSDGNLEIVDTLTDVNAQFQSLDFNAAGLGSFNDALTYWVDVVCPGRCPTRYYYNRDNDQIGTVSTSTIGSFPGSLTIAPNPNPGTFAIFTEGFRPGDYAFQLLDAFGRTLHREDRNVGPGGVSRLQWDVFPKPPAGFYFLRVLDGRGNSLQSTLIIKP